MLREDVDVAWVFSIEDARRDLFNFAAKLGKECIAFFRHTATSADQSVHRGAEQPTALASGVSIVKSNIMRRTSYPRTLLLSKGTILLQIRAYKSVSCETPRASRAAGHGISIGTDIE